MKKKLRIIIDIAMTVLFVILMGYYITGNKVHEILGTITFVLFIIHNILNIKWYKSIFKGKHSFQRTFHIIINLLLFIAMIGMMVSGMIISANVFSFLNIQTTMFGRRLHMVSTSWGFVLMAIHVGLHLNSMMTKINKKMKNSTFEYVYYFILVLITAFGVYSFVNLRAWEDMFLVNDFKFWDYTQSPIMFYLKYIGILLFIAFIIYFIFKIINKIKVRKGRKMQKNIGSKLALYPMPLLVVGTIVDGKANWILVGHSGIIGHDRVMISLHKRHYTNKGIKETNLLSINIVNEEMLKKADYVGSVSGSQLDKSNTFEFHIGDAGSPIINEAPVVMECKVDDIYETETFDNFILKIENTYVQEENLDENNKIDYTKFNPVLFEFPSYTYLRTGETIGKCLKLDEKN